MVEPAAAQATARLAQYTTLRVGGPAEELLVAATEQELVTSVATADAHLRPVLILAGGSNVVVSDDGFPGRVVLVRTRGMSVQQDRRGVTVTVAAGEDWDGFVATAVQRGWRGVEALSGIPGSVGGTPIQNVGAYGQEVADTITSVRCWDRARKAVCTFAAADCGFGYRTSRFKSEPGRFVVLTVTFRLELREAAAPVRYAELAHALAVPVGASAPLRSVREAVLALRRGKGMVLDVDDHDTWSAGSFFTNPLLGAAEADRLPAGAPRWPQPDGRVKTSAAWLIEHAGFGKGYGDDRVRLSTKHPLALTNRSNATTQSLLALAGRIQRGVAREFGVELVAEPVLVGCELPRG